MFDLKFSVGIVTFGGMLLVSGMHSQKCWNIYWIQFA